MSRELYCLLGMQPSTNALLLMYHISSHLVSSHSVHTQEWVNNGGQKRRKVQYSRMAVRTRFVDDRITKFLHSQPGPKQVVLLGAGMDSRAWRMPLPEGKHYSSLSFVDPALPCSPHPFSNLSTSTHLHPLQHCRSRLCIAVHAGRHLPSRLSVQLENHDCTLDTVAMPSQLPHTNKQA